jgi:hypothetical protein
MKDTLKSVGSFVLGICILVAGIFLLIMFLKGGVWLSMHVYPWLVLIASIAFWITVLIFMPLALFRRTRGAAGICTYCVSYVFGLTLWVWSLLLCYTIWGIGGIVAGLILMGIGVVPIAMLASLFNGLWSTLGELALLVLITYGSRLLGYYITSKADNSGSAVNDAFTAASDCYDVANEAIQSFTTRANHRAVIFRARYRYDQSKDTDAYEEEVAAYTDPADSSPYTEAELDAYTVAMENLTAAFDTLTCAFAALNPTHDLYASAAALYKSTSNTYTFAADAYKIAGSLARVTALEGKSQAAKNEAKTWLFETIATNSGESHRGAAEAKAAAFKLNATNDATRAELLEQSVRVAEAKAEVFHTKAKAAEANAEKSLKTSQSGTV